MGNGRLSKLPKSQNHIARDKGRGAQAAARLKLHAYDLASSSSQQSVTICMISAAPPGSGQLSHAWRTVSCCAGPQ